LHLREARAKFDEVKENKSRIYVNPTPKSEVNRMTFIVPFRGMDRASAVRVVLQNLKALKFPSLEIIMAEQDYRTHINPPAFESIKYALATLAENTPFAKAYAFNVGAKQATTDKLILHDADMLVQDDYAQMMYRLLEQHEAVHIGKTVVYLNRESTSHVTTHDKLESHLISERSVGYYEGGSLGVRYNTFVDIGGFCEDFVGYGVEDCEFFNRLQHNTKFFNERSIDLFHLWHTRTNGWDEHHTKNKAIGHRLMSQSMTQRLRTLRTHLISRHGLSKR
jgi:predicted glycosyltransferase involved in capsule biosynthesis